MIETLASMQMHGDNGIATTLATLAAFFILHLIATK